MFRSVRDFLVSTALIALPLAALAGVGAVALQHLPPRAGWVAAALLVLGLGVWVVRRRSRGLAALPRPSPWQREMDALKAIAQVMARGSDLATTAEAILDVVRQAAGFEAGIVYRLDAAAGALLLLAQRGLDEQTLASARVRPLAGTHEGEAARSGVAHLTRIDRSPRMDAAARRISGRRGQRTRAQLALPIPVQGRTWGVLALVFPEARRVGAAELAALDAVAHQVGLAVERAQLQQTAAARLERLEAQREIERHISEQLDLEQLLVIAARSALRLIGGAFSIVFLREGDLLCPRAWAELPDWIREARVPVGTGVVGTAVAAAEGLIVNDYPSSPLARLPFSNAPLRLLVQPLLARGQALGAMLISRDETRAPFTAEDLSALGDFATQAAVAIENARLFAEAQRSAAEYRALFEVAGLVGSTLDAERVLDVIADRCRALMGVASVGIFELEADTGALVYERGVGLSPGFVRALRVQVGEGTTGRAVAERAPVWSADLLADPAITLAPQTRDLVMREGYRAVLSVPILGSGDVPHGALCAYWWESHEPAPAEIELMSALAGQAAIALENARLYGEAATQAERMRAIADLGRTLVSTLDVGRIVETAVTRAVGTLAVARVGICLEDASTGELRFLEPGGAAGSLLDGPVLQRGEGVAGRALAEGRPVWSADILADPAIVFRPATRARLAGGPPRAILALPLERERPLGALVVQREAGHRFTESEIEYLSVFASQVAVALDNARLYAALDTRADRLRTLARLSTVVSSSLDASAVLQAIVRAAAEMMKAMFVTVYVADETGRVLELRAVSDERMGAALPASRRRFGDGLVGWVAEHRQPLAVPDVFEDERASAVEWARRHGLRSF
ncbi:MAG TPA: GAF domain-containing protein, partial [Candidatus Methylomirabilis sp.]|nr:GAF domain-containing protein [Candidatus Methylomirabilis sp.]